MRTTSERGQTTAEYAVVIGMVTLAVVLVISSLSGVIITMFDAARGALA
jgi:Flp pilus assembly pilin Flp